MTTSIAWSKSCFDNASLISLGLKDGEIVLGKYHGSPAAFEQILQVQVFDDNEEWVVGMTWSDWYTIDANSSVALVAVGGNKGSVILLQVFATQYDENSLTVLTGAADCICPRDPFKFTPSMILKFYNDMSNGHARLALAREDSVHVWDCAFRGNQQQQQLLLTKTRVGEPFTSPHIMEIGGIAWDYCSGQSLHIFSVSGVCKTLDLPRIASATNDPQVIVTDISDRIHYFALKPPFASTTNDQDEENAITDIANGTTIKTHQQSGIFQMDINDFELIKVVDMARNAEPVQVFSGIGNTKLFPRFFGADTSGSSCFIALHYQLSDLSFLSNCLFLIRCLILLKKKKQNRFTFKDWRREGYKQQRLVYYFLAIGKSSHVCSSIVAGKFKRLERQRDYQDRQFVMRSGHA